MRKITSIICSTVALSAAIVFASSCNQQAANTTAGETTTAEGPQKGAIVYFNLDRVIAEYDFANDQKAVLETKVQSIEQELNRRGNKLQSDANTFADKVNKGLLTRSVAEQQNAKLQQQQNDFQNYYAQKQQEMGEEQAVTMNQIADAINTFVAKFNEEKQYAMIITTQGDILSAPVVCANPELDITDAIIAGLNAEYVKTKNAETK
ncbi:MAG: OmpH family outer membrane protein [Bacteroidales bacterium]|nr:OmpH family outer membrane protein [Bacteroidales bacterium]